MLFILSINPDKTINWFKCCLEQWIWINCGWWWNFSKENWLIENWKKVCMNCWAYKWFQAIIHCSVFISKIWKQKKLCHYSIVLEFCHFSVISLLHGIVFGYFFLLWLCFCINKYSYDVCFVFLVVVDRLTFIPLSRIKNSLLKEFVWQLLNKY